MRTNVTISATVTGTVPVFYQWYFTDQATLTTVPLAGAITNFVTITNVQITNSGLYYLVATNASGSVASDFSRLVVTNSAVTNTAGLVSPGTPTKLRALSGSSKHNSVSAAGKGPSDAEPNPPARRQSLMAGNSFPEFRREVITPAPVALAFNRRPIYL